MLSKHQCKASTFQGMPWRMFSVTTWCAWTSIGSFNLVGMLRQSIGTVHFGRSARLSLSNIATKVSKNANFDQKFSRERASEQTNDFQQKFELRSKNFTRANERSGAHRDTSTQNRRRDLYDERTNMWLVRLSALAQK